MRQHTAFGVKKVPISPTELRPTFMLYYQWHLPKEQRTSTGAKDAGELDPWEKNNINKLQELSILIQVKVKYIIFLNYYSGCG